MGKQMKIYEIHESDALKIIDVLRQNNEFHQHRDRMNQALHLSSEVRFSPLTSETESAFMRLSYLIQEQGSRGE